MGTTNYGNQAIQWQYYDPLNSDEFDKHNQDIIPVGIYKGGLCSIVSSVPPYVVRMNPLVTMISDGVQAARIATTTPVDVSVTPSLCYIILRWSWQPLVNWYMDVLPSDYAGITANDIVVGKAIFSVGILTGIDYSPATIGVPRVSSNNLNKFLKAEPQTVPDLTVYVNPGYINYGSSKVDYPGGTSPAFPLPGVTNRRDLLWIDSAGVLQIAYGTPGATPVAPSYSGKIPIAEIYLTPTTTSIVASAITDARPWINLGGAGALSGILSSFLTMGA